MDPYGTVPHASCSALARYILAIVKVGSRHSSSYHLCLKGPFDSAVSLALPSPVSLMPIQRPTCEGIRVRSPHDAHVIFHGVALGILPMITRRLDTEERRAITSGCVFVWEERGGHNAEPMGVSTLLHLLIFRLVTDILPRSSARHRTLDRFYSMGSKSGQRSEIPSPPTSAPADRDLIAL